VRLLQVAAAKVAVKPTKRNYGLAMNETSVVSLGKYGWQSATYSQEDRGRPDPG
jgi:hypothetical protein